MPVGDWTNDADYDLVERLDVRGLPGSSRAAIPALSPQPPIRRRTFPDGV